LQALNNTLKFMSMKKELLEYFKKSSEDSDIEVIIQYGLPTISIYRPSDGGEWYFQEHSATELLDSIPEEIHPEEWLKVVANHW